MTKTGCGAEMLSRQAIRRTVGPRPLLIQQLPHPGAKCLSSIRDIPNGRPDGRDTFRTRPGQDSDALTKGENANPMGMVQRI